MSVQEIIVVIIVFICIFYAGQYIKGYFKRVAKGDNPCEGCVSGCELKRQLDKKKKECNQNHKKTKKNCCG